jgi:type I restriction enzyme S subunit
MSWELKSFDELGFIGRGKSRHRPRNDQSLYGGEFPLIQTGDVKNANLYITEYSQTYSQKGLDQSKLWEPNTLCITIAANIADTTILGIQACFPDSIIGFVADENVCDVRFIKYHFDIVQKQMQMVSQGATQDNLSLEKLLKFKVATPPLQTQKRIASILSAYDDLIENNLKRIKLLEETAQNIYKEWFVNFRFPNYEHTEFDTESGLPVGWEVIPFSKCADFINGFAFKPHHHSESGLPIIKIKELKNGLNSETPRYKGEEVPEKYFFTDDTILFSWSADINVYWWANGESILNQHLFKVVPFENVIKEHFYFGLKNSVPEFLSRANGATMKHIKRGELDNVNYTKPNDLIAIKFQKKIKPILKQLVLINSQNQKLKEARDILLPRLMNRTIEV